MYENLDNMLGDSREEPLLSLIHCPKRDARYSNQELHLARGLHQEAAMCQALKALLANFFATYDPSLVLSLQTPA